MYKECRNISGKVVCSLSENHIRQIEEVENICSKVEVSVRELFSALDFDKDGIISRADLEKIVSMEKDDKKYISKNDFKNMYAGMGKKICQGLCNIMDYSQNEYISIDDFLDVLDKDKDGQVHFGNFLKISNRDGNLLFITKEEFEETFEGKWKKEI
jgi:Ca2+-binding EF-hand superfamily protein